MAAFRSIAVAAPEGTLPGTTRPSGFAPTGPRPGKTAASDYFAVFHDTDGAAMVGGSAIIAWYGVSFDGDVLMTASLGDAVVTADHVTHKVEVGEGVWPWPRVTAMTPPSVASKAIDVTVVGDDDGTWSIQVDATTAVTFDASGNTTPEIVAGLVAAFVAHPTATATVVDTDTTRITYNTAGVDFALTLLAPGTGELTEEEVSPVLPVAATLRLYTAASTPSGIDGAALAAVVAGEVAAPTVEEIAAEVDAPSAAEVATAVGAQSAAYAAISQAAQDQVFPIPPTVQEVVTGLRGSYVRYKYGGNFGSAETENQMAAVGANSHVEVLGWFSTGGASQITVELRSGTAGAANDALADAPAVGTIGAGSAINLGPGDTVLWRTADDAGLVLKKSAGSITCHTVVWYRIVPN